MTALRVAIAGAGFASRHHLRGWQRVDAAQVVAICDPDLARAAERAREFGIDRVFDDAAVMLDTVRPDALDVAAPLAAHMPLCLLAADHGVDVICQKPLAPSLAHGEALARETRDRIRLMVHENWRFRAHYRRLKRRLDDGAVGAPISCRLEVRASGLLPDAHGVPPQLRRQPFFAELDRLMVGEVLIHQLDLLRWLLGPLRVVTARTGRYNPQLRGEDHALIVLDAGGAWAVLDGSYVAAGAPPTPSDRLELLGTRGRASFAGDTLRIEGVRTDTQRFDLETGYGDSYAAAIAHFAEALAQDAPFETDVADHLQTLALVDAAYRAAADCGVAIR